MAAATGRLGAIAPDAPRLDVVLLVAALDRLAAVTPAPAPPPEVVPRTITLAERARAIRAALATRGTGACSRICWPASGTGSWRP